MEDGQNWSLAMETVNIKLVDDYADGNVYYICVDKAIVNEVINYFNIVEQKAAEKSVYGKGLKWELTEDTDVTDELAIFDIEAYNKYKLVFDIYSDDIDLGYVFTWLTEENYMVELDYDEDEE